MVAALLAVPAVADLKDMMREIGAKEVGDDGKLRAVPAAPPPPPLEEEPTPDPVALLKKSGIDVTPEKAAEMQDPVKLREVRESTIAQATQTAMYRQVRCEGCQVAAELLVWDLISAWLPKWDEDKALTHTQNFCDSKSFPDDYQVTVKTATGGHEDNVTYTVEYKKEDGPLKIHSEGTMRRICKESVDEHDTDIAELIATKMKGLDKNTDKDAMTPQLRKKVEGMMCKRSCKGEKKKKAAAKKGGEL